MNAATAVAAPTVQHAPSTESSVGSSRAAARVSAAASARQTLVRAIRSEWIKLRTLRSTWVTAVITLFMTTGIGALATVITSKPEYFGSGSWKMAILGAPFGQIVVAVLGALVITGEYSSGQIRSSLAAVPRRSRLFWAKAMVMTMWSFALGALSILLIWALSTPLIGERATSLTNHEFLGYVWGTGLAYAGIGLMSLGLGFLLRSTAGAITVVSSLLFILNLPLSIASNFWSWAGKALYLTPSVTISAVTDPFSVQSGWANGADAPWIGHSAAVAVFAAWVLVPLLAGWLAFTSRDA